MNTLCIADVHLQPDPQHPINQAFRAFLQKEARQAEALYILGDLFEMWVGDDIGLQTYASEITAIRQLTDSGTAVFIQFGNRDFLMRKAFWQATGAVYLKQPKVIEIYQQDYLMLHGDSLCTEDKAYQRMRLLLRNPLVTWAFLKLPPHKRQAIGEKMRANSQKYNLNKAENIMDVSAEAVQKLLKKYPKVTGIIHGHTHRPAYHQHSVQDKTYHRWVLGDWRVKPDEQKQTVHMQMLKLQPNEFPKLQTWQFESLK